MIELWATVGRICIDEQFHRNVFPLTDPTKSFEQLEPLQIFFRDSMLRLARWEVMSLNRIISQEWNGMDIVYFERVEDDVNVGAIRSAFGATFPFPFPQNIEFCAIIGLACIDERHRTDFYNASDPVEANIEGLRALLVTAGGSGHKFRVTDDELRALNRLIRSGGGQMPTLMERFHAARWVQPLIKDIFGACEAGVSLKSYLHVSQQDLALFLAGSDDRDELISRMKAARAIL